MLYIGRREIKGGSGASQGGDKNDWPGANEVTWGETANIHKVKQCPTSDNKQQTNCLKDHLSKTQVKQITKQSLSPSRD